MPWVIQAGIVAPRPRPPVGAAYDAGGAKGCAAAGAGAGAGAGAAVPWVIQAGLVAPSPRPAGRGGGAGPSAGGRAGPSATGAGGAAGPSTRKGDRGRMMHDSGTSGGRSAAAATASADCGFDDPMSSTV